MINKMTDFRTYYLKRFRLAVSKIKCSLACVN